MSCQCTFTSGCAGTGVAHCSPPCGGDLCICICGGENDCAGCDACDPGPRIEGDEEVGDADDYDGESDDWHFGGGSYE